MPANSAPFGGHPGTLQELYERNQDTVSHPGWRFLELFTSRNFPISIYALLFFEKLLPIVIVSCVSLYFWSTYMQGSGVTRLCLHPSPRSRFSPQRNGSSALTKSLWSSWNLFSLSSQSAGLVGPTFPPLCPNDWPKPFWKGPQGSHTQCSGAELPQEMEISFWILSLSEIRHCLSPRDAFFDSIQLQIPPLTLPNILHSECRKQD